MNIRILNLSETESITNIFRYIYLVNQNINRMEVSIHKSFNLRLLQLFSCWLDIGK